MKKLLTSTLLLLSFCFTGNAQTRIIQSAIFSECENAEKPGKCGYEKVEYEISKLITEEITADLKNTLDKNYFVVAFAFLSDTQGKVIPGTLQIKCENKQFYDAIENYVTHLPVFIPKDKSYEERRSAHTYDYTFVYDNSLNKYVSASRERLKEENIKPDYMPLGTIPACKGCENENRDIALQCTSAKVSKIVGAKYRTEKLGNFTGQLKLLATFIIEQDGEVRISEITSNPNNDAAVKELIRALGKLPDFKPGSYMGIPVTASFMLPVTLNIN